ncbi:hypothetical protein PMAYCL1PPCAC_19856, partial [Pristionchus mayeri]
TFSLNELSMFDVPAIIDKVLELSGNEQLYYIGQSGTILGFTTLADNPSYNAKVRKMFALASVGAAHYAKGPIQILFTLYDMLRPLT